MANGKIKGPIDGEIQEAAFECQLLFLDEDFGRFSPVAGPSTKPDSETPKPERSNVGTSGTPNVAAVKKSKPKEKVTPGPSSVAAAKTSTPKNKKKPSKIPSVQSTPEKDKTSKSVTPVKATTRSSQSGTPEKQKAPTTPKTPVQENTTPTRKSPRKRPNTLGANEGNENQEQVEPNTQGAAVADTENKDDNLNKKKKKGANSAFVAPRKAPVAKRKAGRPNKK